MSTPLAYASSSIPVSSAKWPSARGGERIAVGVLRFTWAILCLVAIPPLAPHSERRAERRVLDVVIEPTLAKCSRDGCRSAAISLAPQRDRLYRRRWAAIEYICAR